MAISSIVLATVLATKSLAAQSVTSLQLPAAGPLCQGAYADDFAVLKSEAREFDRTPEGVFSRCTRNTAVYECLSYAPDGAIRRERRKTVAHGTAFGYKRQGGDTLLLTNDHVATWPVVTDDQHAIDGIPAGCKKVSETLSLVDDERDSYVRDDVPLTRVVTDPQLDVAVLRAHVALPVLPWKIGRSSALNERNVVEIRGFPLGAFRATNLGKVISPHDHDDYGDWDHDDFVVDALLSPGNSGSPVLGISCVTGEYELVGIYHAGYSAGSALNVVIGIDQVRDLMTTFKRAQPGTQQAVGQAGGAARRSLSTLLDVQGQMFFPFGSRVAEVRAEDSGALLFMIFPKTFPATDQPVLAMEDEPATEPAAFGRLGAIWWGAPQGLKKGDDGALDADAGAVVMRTLDLLRGDAVAYATNRGTDGDTTSRQQEELRKRSIKLLARVAASRSDQSQSVADLAERLGPQAGEPGTPASALWQRHGPRTPGPNPYACGPEVPYRAPAQAVPPGTGQTAELPSRGDLGTRQGVRGAVSDKL